MNTKDKRLTILLKNCYDKEVLGPQTILFLIADSFQPVLIEILAISFTK